MKMKNFLTSQRAAILAGLLCGLASFFSGGLVFPGENATDEQLRPFAGAIAMPVIIGFLWYATISITKTGLRSIHEFLSNSGQVSNFRTVQKKIIRLTERNIKLALIAAMLIATSYLYAEHLIQESDSFLDWVMILMAYPFWAMIFSFLFQLFSLTSLVIKDFLHNENIDLLGISKLSPMSVFVVNNTAKASILFILIPLFWIGREIPTIDIILVSALLLFLVIFIFLPVFKIQKIIANKKELAIERIIFKLSEAMNANICGGRRITDDPRNLRKIASLISAKAEIAKVREWPVDVPQSIKALAITASAPLSMVAGSLVDYAINQFNLF